MTRTLFRTACAAAALLLGCCAQAQNSWNNARDFSATMNPNGAWSYGWAAERPVGAVPFMLATTTAEPITGFHVWHGPSDPPSIFENTSDHAILYGNDPVCPAGVMGFHPGSGGQNAVVRWTSPFSGGVRLDVGFGTIPLDPTGNTVDVAVVVNGVQVFAATPPRATGATYSTFLRVVTGDTVDFCLGFGNGSYFDDSTSLVVDLLQLCGADFNQDGATDFFDYLDFVQAFSTGDPLADFNQDSVVDFFDYLDFLAAFSAGC